MKTYINIVQCSKSAGGIFIDFLWNIGPNDYEFGEIFKILWNFLRKIKTLASFLSLKLLRMRFSR